MKLKTCLITSLKKILLFYESYIVVLAISLIIQRKQISSMVRT